MRYLLYTTLLIVGTACASSKKTTQETSLNGNWIPVKQEIGGKALPTAAFSTQKLTIEDSSYTFQAESVDRGVAHYGNGQMDIYGKEGVNKGKHFTAIYKVESGQLFICYNLKGDAYPSGFETASKPGLFLSVFKKE